MKSAIVLEASYDRFELYHKVLFFLYTKITIFSNKKFLVTAWSLEVRRCSTPVLLKSRLVGCRVRFKQTLLENQCLNPMTIFLTRGNPFRLAIPLGFEAGLYVKIGPPKTIWCASLRQKLTRAPSIGKLSI